jgi:mono/diheme cytochrome c family protein
MSVIFIAGCLASLTAGCRQDMYNQPRTKPLRPNGFFPNGQSARPLPPHTVSRDAPPMTPEFTGKNPDGTLVNVLPIALKPNEEMRAFLERGRERFEIFCAVCHDSTGSGNGMIVQRGFPQPPSYHIERLRNAPIGHFFDVITNGYGVMYSYAARVPDSRDRWAIAAYIRALQLSRNATPNDVPPDQRAQLNTVSNP